MTVLGSARTGTLPGDRALLEEPHRQLQRRLLERRLLERHASGGAGPTGGLPQVVPLGISDVLRPEHDRYAAARRTATVHLGAQAVLVGPWGAPSAADPRACGHCLAIRWQRLRTRAERDALEVGRATRASAAWPLLPDYAVDAVWAVYQAVVLSDPIQRRRLEDGDWHSPADLELQQVSRIDLMSLGVQTFSLLAEPLCPSCGTSATTVAPALLPLARRQKPAPTSYRMQAPSSYALPTAALANPVCGVLGAGFETNVTSPTTAPVAGSFLVRGYSGPRDIVWSGQHNSFGTSRTLALLEGLERYAGTFRRRRDKPIVDCLSTLGEDALDPRDCGLYSPDTYRADPVLQPFAPDQPIPWLWGYSLRDDRPILVPARLCHYGPSPASDNFVFDCSNGCATGSCLEEAILFGLLELIERDAFLLGWYGGASLTEIDLDACRSGAVRAMVDRADMLGYDVHAIDNRVDLSIPVVTGVAVRRDHGSGTIAFGAGASLDAETAIEAALAEVLTYVPHLRRQVDERRDELEAMTTDFSRVLELRDHAQLFGLPAMTAHAGRYVHPTTVRPARELYADPLGSAADNLLDDLRHCQAELVRIGCDVIVVDQTTSEQARLGLRTVRTIAPGLLPIDFGWSRQRALRMPRLRSAFRQAGRRSTDLADADLHMVPHPFP